MQEQYKKIKEGDLLYFYRSQDSMSVQARGIVEKAIRTNDINEVIAITARRTVFTVTEIKEAYGEDKEALVVLFRQANSFSSVVKLDDMGMNYHPQSIVRLKRGHYNE
jgi:predicted transcriptional regulator